MKRYKAVEVSEAQLEELVRQAPELIEDGLRFVAHQVPTDRGPLDILLVDSGGALVVAELKCCLDDDMLTQALDYYDYVVRNMDSFLRVYPNAGIKAEQEPRLLLIAPEFSPLLLNRIKWVTIKPQLFAYQALEFSDERGSLTPIYKEVTAPNLPTPIQPSSFDDLYDYITDPQVQNLARSFVSQVQAWDPTHIEVTPIQDAISIKRVGRILSYLMPRRKFFLAGYYDDEGNWPQERIATQQDLDAFLPTLRSRFEKIRSSQES
jgi:hypothetical protein